MEATEKVEGEYREKWREGVASDGKVVLFHCFLRKKGRVFFCGRKLREALLIVAVFSVNR